MVGYWLVAIIYQISDYRLPRPGRCGRMYHLIMAWEPLDDITSTTDWVSSIILPDITPNGIGVSRQSLRSIIQDKILFTLKSLELDPD